MTQMDEQADFILHICQEYLHPGKGSSPTKEKKTAIVKSSYFYATFYNLVNKKCITKQINLIMANVLTLSSSTILVPPYSGSKTLSPTLTQTGVTFPS